MFHRNRIILEVRAQTLILAGLLALLAGCGQKGPLYLPTDDPTAAQRATLPQTLLNTVRTPTMPQPPVSAASAAASAPGAAASSQLSDKPASP
jgi:predicted small lipoprotein YifL